jgi:heme/copper-type cytochrome/quinol oxidase subunit 3
MARGEGVMGAIPYSTRVRPDTGLTNGRLGTVLFLISEVMFYGGLFSAYVFLRTAAGEWPPAGAPVRQDMGYLAWGLHFGAAVAVSIAWLRVRKLSRRGVTSWSFLTAVLATGFIAIVGVQHRVLANEGVAAATSTYHAVYYLISNIHRAHVAVGALLAAYMIGPGRTLQLRDSMAYANRVACIAWYWLFLFVAWTVTAVLYHVV